MAVASLTRVLTPSVVTGIVSRIYTPGNPLSRLFGGAINGPNQKKDQVLGRSYSYDIFDNIRKVSYGRQPATGPSSIPRYPVGRVTNTFGRSYTKIPLDYETLNNIRTLGKNAGERDRAGATYLEEEGRRLKQSHENFREYMWGMLLAGAGTAQAYFQIAGDDMVPVVSLGTNPGMTVDWKVPSGNLPGFTGAFQANLNPTGAGNIITAAWSNTATDISSQIDTINRAMQQLIGAPLQCVLTDSLVWRMVVKNAGLQAQGGSANTAFDTFLMEDVRGPDGNKIGILKGVIRAIPWLTWYIIDTGLEIGTLGNETFTYWYNGNLATFLPEINPYWIKGVEGSELVKDNPIAPAVQRYGFHSWLREWDEPARVELHCLQNYIIQLSVPNSVMIGRVA